jgi:site-specific DNA-methyltransferase (adenine-specific)
MGQIPAESIHAIVTDPPYGVKEYEPEQLEKMSNGNGGVWRIPPSFDGHTRSPLPRFTALNLKERQKVQQYFFDWAVLALRILKPGGHIILASNTFLSQIVFTAVADAGFSNAGRNCAAACG